MRATKWAERFVVPADALGKTNIGDVSVKRRSAVLVSTYRKIFTGVTKRLTVSNGTPDLSAIDKETNFVTGVSCTRNVVPLVVIR